MLRCSTPHWLNVQENRRRPKRCDNTEQDLCNQIVARSPSLVDSGVWRLDGRLCDFRGTNQEVNFQAVRLEEICIGFGRSCNLGRGEGGSWDRRVLNAWLHLTLKATKIQKEM